MARPRSVDPRIVQINVRVTKSEAEDLATIQFLSRVTPADLLRRLLEADLERRRKDPRFVQARRLREETDAQDTGRVVSLVRPDEAS